MVCGALTLLHFFPNPRAFHEINKYDVAFHNVSQSKFEAINCVPKRAVCSINPCVVSAVWLSECFHVRVTFNSLINVRRSALVRLQSLGNKLSYLSGILRQAPSCEVYSEETIRFFDRLLFPNNGKSESESRKQSSMRLTCNDSNGFQTSSSQEPRASSPSLPRLTSRVNWTRGRRKSRPRRQRLLPRRRPSQRRGTTPRIWGGTGSIGGRKRRRFVRSFAFLARALLES